jgi:hypothetical protein
MESAHSVGKPDDPVLVVSLPKSGTYLVAELLKALGRRSTEMHLAEQAYSDYRGADLGEARRNPDRFARREPLSESLTRIQPGEFAVGHLPYKAETVQATAPFKRLYLTRDLRSALISYMRFLHSTGRRGAEQMAWYPIPDVKERLLMFLLTTAPSLLKWHYEPMVGWSQLDGITPVSFEDLTAGDERAIRVIDSVAAFLGVENYDAQRMLQSILATETITKSDKLTRLNDYWSVAAERQFIEIGGPELNARLGCLRRADHRLEISDPPQQPLQTPPAATGTSPALGDNLRAG